MPKYYNEENNPVNYTNCGTTHQDVYAKKLDTTTNTYKIYIKETIAIYDKIQEASIGTTLQELIAKYGTEEQLITEITTTELPYLDTRDIPEQKIQKDIFKKEIQEKINKLNEELKKQQEKLENPEPEKKQETEKKPKTEINNTNTTEALIEARLGRNRLGD